MKNKITCSKRVDVYDLRGNLLSNHRSGRVAADKYNIPFQRVSDNIRNRLHQTGGLVFLYQGGEFNYLPKVKVVDKKTLRQCNYKNLEEASLGSGYSKSSFEHLNHGTNRDIAQKYDVYLRRGKPGKSFYQKLTKA